MAKLTKTRNRVSSDATKKAARGRAAATVPTCLSGNTEASSTPKRSAPQQRPTRRRASARPESVAPPQRCISATTSSSGSSPMPVGRHAAFRRRRGLSIDGQLRLTRFLAGRRGSSPRSSPLTCGSYLVRCGATTRRLPRSKSCAPPCRRCSQPQLTTACLDRIPARGPHTRGARQRKARRRPGQGPQSQRAWAAAGRAARGLATVLRVLGSHRPADQRGGRAAMGTH